MPTAFLLEADCDCTSNGYLTSGIKSFLRGNGVEFCRAREEADLVVLLGCDGSKGATELAQALRGWARLHPEKHVVAMGCAPALAGVAADSANFQVLPFSKLMEDPESLRLPFAVREPFRFQGADDHFSGLTPGCIRSRFPKGGSLFFVRAADGSRSVPLEETAYQARRAAQRGRTRLVLMGQDLGRWGEDLGLDLADLLDALGRAAPEARVLLEAVGPGSLERVLPRLGPRLDRVESLCLPIGAGGPGTLELLARGMAALKRLKARPRLTTDVLVGSPGQSDEAFAACLRAAAAFDAAFFFAHPEAPASAAVERRMAVVRAAPKKLGFVEVRAEP